jgi:hypothetical protein
MSVVLQGLCLASSLKNRIPFVPITLTSFVQYKAIHAGILTSIHLQVTKGVVVDNIHTISIIIKPMTPKFTKTEPSSWVSLT